MIDVPLPLFGFGIAVAAGLGLFAGRMTRRPVRVETEVLQTHEELRHRSPVGKLPVCRVRWRVVSNGGGHVHRERQQEINAVERESLHGFRKLRLAVRRVMGSGSVRL